ncbi:MAG TPA: glycosyltransferase family 9 protein [Segeticoccus sp.]|uniref:glycosyltransferase family 9 protein n=1 Tax=Segeticoccus sp. TaxID=2706531 RepID=UPI002D80D1A9|nr:glycosyltransferase family 9 protein [Segeticoccus sp.]HET8600394.1 glycosyltransferase family 9 protein [Segeticoccus sp.]
MTALPAEGHLPGVHRIVALRANGIGDFVVAVPALAALRCAYPAAELTIIGNEWLPEFLHDRPGPWDRVLVAPHAPGLRDLPPDAEDGEDVAPFVEAERARSPELAVQLHGGGGTSNPFLLRLGATVTIGARAPGAPALDRTTGYAGHRNEVLRWLEVVGLVGATVSGVEALEPRIGVTPTDLAESDGLRPGGPFAALAVGARDPRRRWSPRRFAAVADHLAACGLPSVLVGGEQDRETAARVDGLSAAPCVDLTGKLSLGGTLGLLHRARLFVGNDSGPRHLAVAAGTPTVGIFWVDNALTFGPLVGPHRIAVSHREHCPSCGRPQRHQRCVHDESFVDDVEAAEVLSLAEELLDGHEHHHRLTLSPR